MKKPKAPSVTPPNMPFPSIIANFGNSSGGVSPFHRLSQLSRAALPEGQTTFSPLDRRRTSALSSKSTLGGAA